MANHFSPNINLLPIQIMFLFVVLLINFSQDPALQKTGSVFANPS